MFKYSTLNYVNLQNYQHLQLEGAPVHCGHRDKEGPPSTGFNVLSTKPRGWELQGSIAPSSHDWSDSAPSQSNSVTLKTPFFTRYNRIAVWQNGNTFKNFKRIKIQMKLKSSNSMFVIIWQHCPEENGWDEGNWKIQDHDILMRHTFHLHWSQHLKHQILWNSENITIHKLAIWTAYRISEKIYLFLPTEVHL
jgi:hypothetical protein